MTDVLLNTLLAAMAICTSHMSTYHVAPNGAISAPTAQYEQGYEQCIEISKAVDTERERRAKVEAENKKAEDAFYIKNALAGLHGKSFTEEPKPKPPRSPFGYCMDTISN